MLSIRPYIEHVFGAWRVVGGPAVLIDALYERCVKRGVTFRFGTAVRSVASGSVTLADGERLGADTIVAALDARVLAGLTGAKPSRGSYSPSAFSVRLEGPSGIELPHESVFFGEGGLQPTIRVHVAPERPTEWIASVEATIGSEIDARRLADDLTKRLGIAAKGPGAAADGTDALIVRDVLTPMDRERLTGTPGGSLHGPTADSLSSAVLRSPTVQPIKGLLHIGASARPGPGVAFAALGAWNAAEVLRPTRV